MSLGERYVHGNVAHINNTDNTQWEVGWRIFFWAFFITTWSPHVEYLAEFCKPFFCMNGFIHELIRLTNQIKE